MARNILVNAVLTIFILLFVGSYLSKTKLYTVMSNSMAPNINKGDLILVREDSRYMNGDVITFRYENQFVTHRIINIENNLVTTKGDANVDNDLHRIALTDIIGGLYYRIPYLGLLFMLLKSKYIFLTLFMLLIYYFFIKQDNNYEK